jgi:hypothetical protein
VAKLQGEAQLAQLQLAAKQAAAAAKAQQGAQAGMKLTQADLQQQVVDAVRQSIPELQAAANPQTGIQAQAVGPAVTPTGQVNPSGMTAADIHSAANYAAASAAAYLRQQGQAQGAPSTLTPAEAAAGARYAGQSAALYNRQAAQGYGAATAAQAMPGGVPIALAPPPPPLNPAQVAGQSFRQGMAYQGPPPAPAAGINAPTPTQAALGAYGALAPQLGGGNFPITTIERAQGQLQSPEYMGNLVDQALNKLGGQGFTATPAALTTARAQAINQLVQAGTTGVGRQVTAAGKAATAAAKTGEKAQQAAVADQFAQAYGGANLNAVASAAKMTPLAAATYMLDPGNAANAQRFYQAYTTAINAGQLKTTKAATDWLDTNVTDINVRNILKAMKLR